MASAIEYPNREDLIKFDKDVLIDALIAYWWCGRDVLDNKELTLLEFVQWHKDNCLQKTTVTI